MKHAAALLVLLAAAGCAGRSGDESTLKFYDWLNLRIAEFNAALDSRNHALMVQIEQKISEMTGKRYDEVATDAASSTDPARRWLAVIALGFSHRPESAAHLEPRLADADPMVRGAAAAAFGNLHAPNPPVAKIAALLDDATPETRLAALFALKELLPAGSDAPCLARVIEFLDDREFRFRSEAVLVLGATRRPDHLSVLVKRALKDDHDLVRMNAAMAIGGYGADGTDAVPTLIERLKDREANVVEAAYWALKQITGRTDADRSYGAWREWYDDVIKLFEYACPQHPEVVREFGGPCPQCGARLEPRSKADPNFEYYCPKDPDVVLPKWGKCPKCKASLVPRRRDAVK